MSEPSPPTEQTYSEEKVKTIGHYTIGKTIGEGTFGKVKLGTHLLTGEKVAIKILEKEKITDVNDVERVAREIHILKLIRHPNIIQLYEIIETPKQLYLIMEYAQGGELFEYIVSNNRIKEKEACKFFRQIIAGIEYIHKLGVVHRDLKPENLLLDHNKDIKIVDFGLSNTYKPGDLLKTACGSPCYAAPEMIAGKKYHGLQVDIWSCGVILFALLCGYLPFEDANTGNLYKKILSGEFHIPRFVSAEARDLLKSILTTDAAARITIDEIRNHPWYNIIRLDREPDGIIIGVNTVPVDMDILKELEYYNIDLNQARACVEANKHNHLTTTYYLLLQRFLRNGGVSNADLSRMKSPHKVTTKAEKISKKEINILPEASSPISKTEASSPRYHNKINLANFVPVKGTVNVNVNVNVNLNNLNTSLTKEYENSIVSSLNTKKNRELKLKTKTIPDDFDTEEGSIDSKPLGRQISPVSRTHRDDNNKIPLFKSPRQLDPETPKSPSIKAKYVKMRKDSDSVSSPTTGVGSPRPSVQAQQEKKAQAPSKTTKSSNGSVGERVFTESTPTHYLATENDVIYETLNSSRLGEKDKPDIKSSRRVVDIKPRSPSPRLHTAGNEKKATIFHKIATKTKTVVQNQSSENHTEKKGDSRPNSRTESRTEENIKPVRDNYVTTTLHKKLVLSPRLNTSTENPRDFPATTTNAKQVSMSTNFVPGTLAPPGSFIDRTSIDRPSTGQIAGMKPHYGPFHNNSISVKNPKYLMSELSKAVESHKIYHRNTESMSIHTTTIKPAFLSTKLKPSNPIEEAKRGKASKFNVTAALLSPQNTERDRQNTATSGLDELLRHITTSTTKNEKIEKIGRAIEKKNFNTLISKVHNNDTSHKLIEYRPESKMLNFTKYRINLD